jgi:hypothetical protein
MYEAPSPLQRRPEDPPAFSIDRVMTFAEMLRSERLVLSRFDVLSEPRVGGGHPPARQPPGAGPMISDPAA